VVRVALVHEAVTDQTWDAIMEYEKLHHAECPGPRLARFAGMFGHHTIKARLAHLFGFDYPYDRHDWVVDRCGTEHRYIIDYYSLDDDTYTIDARPAPTLGGLWDRARVAVSKWRAGESLV
jgi:cytochrome c heme-lyase